MGAAVAWAPEPAAPFTACHARFEQMLQVAGSQELPTARIPACAADGDARVEFFDASSAALRRTSSE